MDKHFQKIITEQLKGIRRKGLYKEEHVLTGPQGREVRIDGKTYLNFCSNNYLGLADDAKIIAAGKKALQAQGYGLSSVRFICGTTKAHRDLEKNIAKFVGFKDAVLYASCFDANTALFQAISGPEDIIFSDALNHASIIDGIRLSKAEKMIYRHRDMTHLEECLQKARQKRLKIIVTDGVFSMEGGVAPLKEICDLAEKYQALVVVDDSHATGFVGKNGRGTHEYAGVKNRVDIITSTFGKALGGASGGFIATSKTVVEFLRQRSRNYIFSNSMPPVVVGANAMAVELAAKKPQLRKTLWENVRLFRKGMQEAGFAVSLDEHPIVPIMVGDAKKAKDLAKKLFAQGIYVVAFSYPVVPEGKARVRVQISAAHTKTDIKKAVEAFVSCQTLNTKS